MNAINWLIIVGTLILLAPGLAIVVAMQAGWRTPRQKLDDRMEALKASPTQDASPHRHK